MIFSRVTIFCILLVCGCDVTTPRGDIKIAGAVYDFGAILTKDVAEKSHTFKITNQTRFPVIVANEFHSCSCTEAEIKLGTLRPNESTELKVTVTMTDNYARSNVSSNVLIKYPERHFEEIVVFTISYETFPTSLVTPSQVDFGEIDSAMPVATKSVWLDTFASNQDALPLPELTRLNLPRDVEAWDGKDELIAAVTPAIWRRRRKLNVTLKGSLSDGNQRRQLTIPIANAKSAAFDVAWRKRSRFEVDPASLALVITTSSIEEMTKNIIITSKNGAFAIRQLVIEPPEAPLTATILGDGAASQSKSISVHFDMRAKSPGTIESGVLRLSTTKDDSAEVTIPWAIYSQTQP